MSFAAIRGMRSCAGGCCFPTRSAVFGSCGFCLREAGEPYRGLRAYLKDFLGEKETALAGQLALMESEPRNTGLARSRAVLRMNYLRNLSQWEGPRGDGRQRARNEPVPLSFRDGAWVKEAEDVIR